jgi:17 kDa outer membrane surface antigen
MGRRRLVYTQQSMHDPATFADRRGTNFARRWRQLRRAAPIVGLCFSFSLGGCSFSIAPLLGDSDTTGASKPVEPISSALDLEDWRRAKAAMALALDPKGDGTTVHWDNPTTAANGAFTAVGEPYSVRGRTCRSFLADVTTHASGQHLRGEACRGLADEWAVSMVNDIAPTQ